MIKNILTTLIILYSFFLLGMNSMILLDIPEEVKSKVIPACSGLIIIATLLLVWAIVGIFYTYPNYGIKFINWSLGLGIFFILITLILEGILLNIILTASSQDSSKLEKVKMYSGIMVGLTSFFLITFVGASIYVYRNYEKIEDNITYNSLENSKETKKLLKERQKEFEADIKAQKKQIAKQITKLKKNSRKTDQEKEQLRNLEEEFKNIGKKGYLLRVPPKPYSGIPPRLPPRPSSGQENYVNNFLKSQTDKLTNKKRNILNQLKDQIQTMENDKNPSESEFEKVLENISKMSSDLGVTFDPLKFNDEVNRLKNMTITDTDIQDKIQQEAQEKVKNILKKSQSISSPKNVLNQSSNISSRGSHNISRHISGSSELSDPFTIWPNSS